MSAASRDPGAGFRLQSPVDRPDGVPQDKGDYSIASRALALSSYFFSGALAVNFSQFLGSPLALVNEDWYNTWIAFTKQSFGLLTMTLTQAFAPTKVIVSGDESVRGQMSKSADGNLKLDFPSRLILIANHQIYTDWLYLWWIAYCNDMHGRLYIVLKESLKKIPVLGWGMQMSQFIFLKRNWEQDRPHMASALQKLNKATEPMWLLIFPEGTNLAPSTREKSKAFAQKSGIKDMQHTLLPRATGLRFIIEELKGTTEYIYDCTVAYEGVPRGQFAQDIFTLKAGYLEGRPPKSVSMHWRRFAVKDIPMKDPKNFEIWLTNRWREKDSLIEYYLRTGKFPADTGATKYRSGEIKRGGGHLEVQIRSSHWYEFLQIFAPMGVLAMVLAVFYGAIPKRLWQAFNQQALKSGAADLQKAGAQAGSQVKSVSKSAAGLTLDDFFDQDKQEDSFKKGAMAVQRFLGTPQAETLMNRVDFATSLYNNPQKTVGDAIKGPQKTFLKSIEEEELRRRKQKLPTAAQNVGPGKGTFWKDLEKVQKGRNGSVVSAPSSKPAATFLADLKAAEKKGTLGSKGTFWDKVKAEENIRYGTMQTLSSGTTAVGSVSSTSGPKKLPTAKSTTKPASKPTKLEQTSKASANKQGSKQTPGTKTSPPAATQKANTSKAAGDATQKPKAAPKLATPSKPATNKTPAPLPKATPQAAKKSPAPSTNAKPQSPVKAPSSTVTKPSPSNKAPAKLQASPNATKPTTTQSKPQPAKQSAAQKQPPKLSK